MGVAILVLGLWFVRLVLPSQVDDVSPLMGCSEDVLDLADVYFVVPKFDGVEIGGVWCDKMKNLASSSGWGLGVGRIGWRCMGFTITLGNLGLIEIGRILGKGLKFLRSVLGLRLRGLSRDNWSGFGIMIGFRMRLRLI